METRARYISVGLFVLLMVAAGFAFVYWLNNHGGLEARSTYQIRFEDSVSGLQIGAAVQFNGIRVGEVTELGLDKDDPRRVAVNIAVDRNTPVRADTKVGVTFQGLMGSPAISLSGGTPGATMLASAANEPHILVAEPGAAEDLAQAARQALQHFDQILQDNSSSIKTTIGNLKSFSGALARNSDKVDAILTGLARLAGGGPAAKPKPIYDLMMPSTSPTRRAVSKTLLVVAMPTAIDALQTPRMLARASDGEISHLGDAQWSDSLPNLIQAKVVQGLDDAGFQVIAALPEQEVAANHRLLIDLRNFAVSSNPDPKAEILLSAKFLDQDGHIVATKLFHATAPVKGTRPAQIAAAFDEAFARILADLIAWTAEST